MRSRFVLAATALLLLGGALPAVAASPIGVFDGKPGGGNNAWGQMQLVGWALDDNGVAYVDIVIDDSVYQRALYGLRRPDVTRRKPGFPNSNAPGFAATVDTTHFLNGVHEVSALVTSLNGEQVVIGPVRQINFRNASHMLAPFGHITFPQQDAEMRGRCSNDPTRRLSVVTGNALDAGSSETARDTGVAWVELLLDGALTFNTLDSCYFDTTANMLLNCYGLESRELTFVYPNLINSDRAKWRFALDVGALISSGLYSRGHHTITIRAGDYGDNVRNIASINVAFSCDDEAAVEPSIGQLEEPSFTQPWFGTITVKGWAVDFQGISSIDIKVNGQVVGQATLGGPRPDVAELFPGYPSNTSAGWTFNYDTRNTNDGRVTFEVWVHDLVGDETLIGEGQAIIDNRDHP
ncbi:MAG TPA: Ig-like domain-containing protein [Thermoanaerobaculia bacterium]|jgi:N-acetylmuramoyl-L-alanine amidase|nr:Ig-like domain-containing protein [Thermoanaerobaculia bacterium]